MVREELLDTDEEAEMVTIRRITRSFTLTNYCNNNFLYKPTNMSNWDFIICLQSLSSSFIQSCWNFLPKFGKIKKTLLHTSRETKTFSVKCIVSFESIAFNNIFCYTSFKRQDLSTVSDWFWFTHWLLQGSYI